MEKENTNMILRRKIFYSVLFTLLPIVTLMQDITLLRLIVTFISTIIAGYNMVTLNKEVKKLKQENIKKEQVLEKQSNKEDNINVKVIDNTLKRNEKEQVKVKKIGSLKR